MLSEILVCHNKHIKLLVFILMCVYYRSAVKGMSASQKSDDKTIAWSNVVQHMRKNLSSRVSTTISQFDLHRLMNETSSMSANVGNSSDSEPDSSSEVLVFTCGHHFSKHNFDMRILDSFESRVVSRLPVAGGLIMDKYRGGDCMSLACPQCVQSSLQPLLTS